jgi:hypothetical protein
MTATHKHTAAQGVALASVLWILSWWAAAAVQAQSQQSPGNHQPWQPPQARPANGNGYPQPCPTACRKCFVPLFGHYEQGNWRTWPGSKPRLEIENPRAPDAEVMPTPQGREQVPLPRATMQPQPMPQQQALPPQQALPQQPVLPAQPALPPQQPPESSLPPSSAGDIRAPSSEGGQHEIVPPKGLLIPSKPEEAYPSKPKAEAPPPSNEPEEALPALPSEPRQSPKDKPKEPPKNGSKDASKASLDNTYKPTGQATVRIEAGLAGDTVHATKIAERPVFRIEVPPMRSEAPLAPIALTSGIEPDRNTMQPAAHRADSIATAAPTAGGTWVEPAAYAVAESTPKPTARQESRAATVAPSQPSVEPAPKYAVAEPSSLATQPEARPMLPPTHEPAPVAEPAAYTVTEPASAMAAQPEARPLVQSQPVSEPTIVTRPVESRESVATAAPSMPEIALGGFCPVDLCQNSRWTQGDVRWTVVHNGFIYRLSGAEQRKQFLANPERFAPVNSGNDPVISHDDHRSVPGKLEYCAVYNDRLYVFSSAATQARFNENPQRYTVR